MSTDDPASETFRWKQPDGTTIACIEKIKVLAENAGEIRAIAQDAFEDALLMGCDEAQVRTAFAGIVGGLRNPYRKSAGGR